MQRIDTLIHPRWIIPVEPPDMVLEDHALAVHEGRILSLLPGQEALQRYQSDHLHQLPRHVLIPGLINSHTHAAMSLFRGLADDLPLMEWLQGHIWPAERQFVNAEFVYDGTRLAAAEMLRGGTTCFNDMYFFPDQAARASQEAGIRAVVGLILIDFPTVWARDADEYIARGLEVHKQYRQSSLVYAAFAPHAPYTVTDGPLARIRELADLLDIPIHMHVQETAEEIRQHQAIYKERPLARLARLGLLSHRLLAVHLTQVQETDLATLAESRAHVVHCPESNLKLASGFCPVERLLQTGVNVALGTDGAASNDDLDMLAEMRVGALLAKGVAGSASALPASQALRMATLHGARALGLEHLIGSLLPGKAADLAAIDLGCIETQPVYHPLPQLVYSAARHQVTDVWVAGRQVLKGRELTTLDEAELLSKAQEWQARIGMRAKRR
jgi:5-methylthioadenosine/S-adenosylhomocysteine deaminase